MATKKDDRKSFQEAPLDCVFFNRRAKDIWVYRMKLGLDPVANPLGMFGLTAMMLLDDYTSSDGDSMGIQLYAPPSKDSKVAQEIWLVRGEDEKYGFFPTKGGVKLNTQEVADLLDYNWQIATGKIPVPPTKI